GARHHPDPRGGTVDQGLACRLATHRTRRTDVADGEVESEGAAHSRRAPQLDLAAEQVGQLAADGQAEAGAPVLPGGAGVGLLEGLEDDLLLLGCDADAGIRNL